MTEPTRGPPGRTADRCSAVLDEIERAVVGHRRSLELVLIGILAGGHVLLEDLPGLGKTLIARSFATALGLDFARIQFTPDLLPSDVVGAPLYDQRTGEMVFRPGPVFTQLLLADEINRTPPKTQAALLEAMGEGQVSMDGVTRPLPQPFVVLATDNPIEYEGTYELPEAQLDRFLHAAAPRLPGHQRRGRDAAAPAGPPPRGRHAAAGDHRRRADRHARRRWSRSRSPPTCSTTSSRSSRPPAATRRSRSAPARAAAWRWSSWPAAQAVLEHRDYRHPRRRQSGRRARPRPPDHAATRAVGAPGQIRRRHRRAARHRAGPPHRPGGHRWLTRAGQARLAPARGALAPRRRTPAGS